MSALSFIACSIRKINAHGWRTTQILSMARCTEAVFAASIFDKRRLRSLVSYSMLNSTRCAMTYFFDSCNSAGGMA